MTPCAGYSGESGRAEEVNVRRGGEGGRTAASAHTGSGRQAHRRHSIFITLIHISSAAKPLRYPPQPAEVSCNLRRASPLITHFSSGAWLFLARPRKKLSFRSSYLPQFLEYLMKNGDLRAAVRAFLPPRNPNCTSHMRLFADGRDPPLPTALHVSTVRCRGITRVRVRGSGTCCP